MTRNRARDTKIKKEQNDREKKNITKNKKKQEMKKKKDKFVKMI